MGTRDSRLLAWTAVRGNPSSMNEADELSDFFDDGADVDETLGDGTSHPLEVSSEDINSRMVASGTSWPASRAD